MRYKMTVPVTVSSTTVVTETREYYVDEIPRNQDELQKLVDTDQDYDLLDDEIESDETTELAGDLTGEGVRGVTFSLLQPVAPVTPAPVPAAPAQAGCGFAEAHVTPRANGYRPARVYRT